MLISIGLYALYAELPSLFTITILYWIIYVIASHVPSPLKKSKVRIILKIEDIFSGILNVIML